jgi:hypothetical protein
MSQIPPLELADLPERRLAFWKMTGPGAILVGLSIGAGELVLWPWITAKFGPVMVWAAALGLFLQLWINLEIGRWALSTGEAPYTGFGRVFMGSVRFLVMLGFLLLLLPGWARMSGAALKALLFGPEGPGPDWVWTGITFAGIAVILFGPRVMYATLEKVVSLLVLVVTLGLVFVAVRVGTLEALGEMARGFLSFGHIELDDELTFARFFGAVVFAGVGGLGNLWYAFYLRDKQIGMGGRIPRLVNPLRQQAEARSSTGFVFADTDENRRRFRDWFRFVVLDQTLYFFLLNGLTMFLFMFGALTVLRPLGVVPTEGQIVWDMALILGDTMGSTGRYLFLIIGMATLFSTQLTIVDGGAREWAYIFNTSFRWGKRLSQSRWYVPLALFYMAAGTASTFVFERLDVSALGFVFNSALIGGIAMAVYVPLLLVINLRYLPPSARPRPLNVVMVSLGGLLYISFALYTFWDVVFG